jgi:rod shape-determining protein MreC
MVAEALKLTQPLRAALATALYPLQWLVMQPVWLGTERRRAYFGTVKSAQQTESQEAARQKLACRPSAPIRWST